jgi:MoaA/NifB/PqqE/SkfB family radical SAM enzyme
MNFKKNQNKIEYYSCRKAKPVMLKFRLSLLKYFLQSKNYPLFTIRSSDGGIIKTYEVQKKLKLTKFVRHNNHYYFSLTLPHWPSKAFDHMVANGGLNITAAGTRIKKQIDIAILGITRKCSYECNHCYEQFNLSDADTVPVTRWKKVIAELQNSGVSIITLSGGEPMMRYDEVLEMLRSADHSRSDFHIHTSGSNVTHERAAELKIAGLQAAGVGLDDCDPDRNDKLRGTKGAHEQAVRAIKCFQEAGIFTYVNTCLTKELIHSGELLKYFEMLKDLNVGIVRWLEPKPCGGYFDRNPSELLSPEEKKIITEFYKRENMGCMMAGNSQLYIDTLGNVEPCVFLPVSFGNIKDEDFSDIFRKLKEAVPGPLYADCPSVQLSSKIKSKKELGIAMPISYKEMTEEFESLRRNNDYIKQIK